MARRVSVNGVFVFAAVLLCLLATVKLGFAQEASSDEMQPSGAQEAPVYLKFVNSYSGSAISTVQVEADGAPVQATASHGSLMMLMLPEGPHKLKASAEGYNPMELDVNVTAGDMPVVEIELDPTETAQPEQVADDTAVVRGTVLDADTAEPVAGARLSVADSGLASQTTATGEFRFEVRTGRATETERPAMTLEASAQDYQAVRLANIPLAPGSETRIPVKLSRPTSATEELDVVEIDQWTSPGNDFSSEWTFDVTVR